MIRVDIEDLYAKKFEKLVAWTESVLGLSFIAPKYTLIRFEIKKIRGKCPYGGCVQMSQILLENDGCPLDLSTAGVTCSGVPVPADPIENILCKSGKWCSLTWNCSIIIKFSEPTLVNGFGFITGNDFPERDPLQWLIQGSNNGNNWLTLHNQNTDYVVPLAREEVVRFDSFV